MSNTNEKAPINWHVTCRFTRIYEDFKELFFRSLQGTFGCLKDSESDSYDENDMKEKVIDLVRLHNAMQEKLKTALYSEQIRILTLVPVQNNAFEYIV